MRKKVRKAILPVAGFGTRFLPATKAQPKEMLAVIDKPVIQYIVEDAVKSGIEEIIFVTGRGKRAIEDHFDVSYELEVLLTEKEKQEELGEVHNISKLAKFSYVRQPVPAGDGDAILRARHLVGEEAVLVLFGDCLYDNDKPVAKEIIDVYEKYGDPVIGLSEINKEDVSKFGIVEGINLDGKVLEIKSIAEKPKPEETDSNLAAVGKYIITPEIMDVLESMRSKKSKELGLSAAFNKMLSNNRPIYGNVLDGEWLDTGDKFSLLRASIVLGLKNPVTKDKLKKYLNDIKL